jgi:putative PIN family toxin of toxin-antitoxin system
VLRQIRRVVIDTNVWISALINPAGPPAMVVEMVRTGRLAPIVSALLLAELQHVIERPRIGRRLGARAEAAPETLALLGRAGIPVVPTGAVRICRDPDDDVLIEMAVLGAADAIVTRDGDIAGDDGVVAYLRERGVEVLSVARLLERAG